MVRGLLIRGMLAGLAAGILAFAFAKLFGEPPLDKAIAFEGAVRRGAAGQPRHAVDARPADRHRRLRRPRSAGSSRSSSPPPGTGRSRRARRATAAILAAAGFVVIFLVPFVKYPSNPPAVGNPETIGERTQLYFLMLGISVAAAIAARAAAPVRRRSSC